ncbi:MAG: hypothetical protein IM574_02890 [Cytophagales bacterium]|jgi:hypothetical protein|nr:hypothetical protein [Cytophagales bacterium]MCA6386994.1 hypothetical protein [Cytophagales bacterium]MCA6390084.1 hypothetical protein [Cytophagales bacterium]MCA6395755.1 hypothetical protein [Cytophagales bacterium]MCA6399409.1 hypothetical protein [Cytophagales bacterium]
MLHKKGIFLIVLLLSLFQLASAQVANSPFSSFGIGDLYGNSLAQNQGMGGIGISNPSSWYVNNQNPALLINNYVTTFHGGMMIENRTIKDGTSSLQNTNGNLNYLVMAFPIKPGRWTTSIGLTPYSGVNYKLTVIEPVDGSLTSTVQTSRTGTGGINQLSWANGVKINKYAAVGVRANYLFSSINNQEEAKLPQTIYTPFLEERNYVSDISFSTGLYLHKDSITKKNYQVNIGVIYDLQTTVGTRRTIRLDTRSAINGSIVDSTTLVNNQASSIVLPQTLGVGLSFGRPTHWMIGADVSYLDYQQFRGFTGQATDTRTGIRSAFGIEIMPDQTGVSSYLRRMTYRAGLSYDQYPYLVAGNQVNDFGVNFGVSLPVARISTIDFSVKIGSRGSIVKNTIEENYFKIYLGMTFNDNWFIKRKFD